MRGERPQNRAAGRAGPHWPHGACPRPAETTHPTRRPTVTLGVSHTLSSGASGLSPDESRLPWPDVSLCPREARLPLRERKLSCRDARLSSHTSPRGASFCSRRASSCPRRASSCPRRASSCPRRASSCPRGASFCSRGASHRGARRKRGPGMGQGDTTYFFGTHFPRAVGVSQGYGSLSVVIGNTGTLSATDSSCTLDVETAETSTVANDKPDEPLGRGERDDRRSVRLLRRGLLTATASVCPTGSPPPATPRSARTSPPQRRETRSLARAPRTAATRRAAPSRARPGARAR
jgi:hypothetical protein